MEPEISPINKPIQPPAPKPPVAPGATPVATPPGTVSPTGDSYRESTIPFTSKIQSPVPPPAKPAPKISSIRTFRGDVNAGVQGNTVTLTSIALANQAKKNAQQPDLIQTPTPTKRRIAPAIAIMIGILLMGSGIYVLYSSQANQTAPVSSITVVPPSLIFTESTTVIDTSQITSVEALKNMIAAQAAVPPTKNGKVLALAFTAGQGAETRLLSAQEFFTVVTPQMPANLLRSLESDFLLGIYSHEKNEPFIMLENSSYENSFAGMLAWEERMAQDILPLLGRKAELRNTRVSLWKDKVIRNIDTRIETDENGAVTLIYSFINRKTLVIASSEVGFIEALTRFHTPRPVTR